MDLFHRPRISKSGRVTQTSYDLPYRVFCTTVYPIKARNGSTILLYGHSNGLRIVWRGGHPLKHTAQGADGNSSTSAEGSEPTEQPDSGLDNDPGPFESSNDTSSIVQDLDLPFETEVLSIALPPITSRRPSGVPAPDTLDKNMILAVACGDSSVKVLSIPLEAPSSETKQKLSVLPPEKYANTVILSAGPKAHNSPPTNVALTWTARDHTQPTEMQDADSPEWDLLVASAGLNPSSVLLLTRIPLASKNARHVLQNGAYAPFQRLHLSSQTVSLAFNNATYPSRRHTQLLVTERSGKVHIYDPFGASSSHPSPDSDRDSAMGVSADTSGAWVSSFTTTYQPKPSAAADLVSPALAHPKPLLAAVWALQGHSALLLASDGEIGLWNVESDNPNDYRLLSFLASSKSGSGNDSSVSEPRSGLAPMTPNTRATKAQRLFSSPTPASKAAAQPRGGLNVKTRNSHEGEESIVLWYGDSVYSIANLQSYTKRNESTSRSTGSVFGSGLARIEGLNLRGEMITSAAQLPFADSSRESHSHPDVVLSADSRIIVLNRQDTTSSFGSSALVRQQADEEMEDAEEDRADMELLSREELGITGIEKLANQMSRSTVFGRSEGRKVLFASS